MAIICNSVEIGERDLRAYVSGHYGNSPAASGGGGYLGGGGYDQHRVQYGPPQVVDMHGYNPDFHSYDVHENGLDWSANEAYNHHDIGSFGGKSHVCIYIYTQNCHEINF